MRADADELADVPPEEFVAARDQLARRLKASGERARAAEVKKLRRPTVPQWIAHQVGRRHGELLESLRGALRELATAQEAAITSGQRHELREAATKRRDAVGRIGRAVEEVLADEGRPDHYRDEVVSSIESDLTAEVVPGPFGVSDDLELPERPRENEPVADPAAQRRAEEARVAIREAELRVSRARQELRTAESDLEAVVARHGRTAAPADDSRAEE